MADKHKVSNWKVPFLVGILLTAGGGVLYRVLNPPIEARTVRLARILNTDPRKLQRVDEIRKGVQEATQKKTELPDKEWDELVAIFNDPNENIRLQAIRIMASLGETRRRDTILNMVRPLLEGSPMIQVSTLNLLRRFKDPSWKAEAQKRVNSPDDYLREIASALLKENGVKK